jgi:hypothetical protein
MTLVRAVMTTKHHNAALRGAYQSVNIGVTGDADRVAAKLASLWHFLYARATILPACLLTGMNTSCWTWLHERLSALDKIVGDRMAHKQTGVAAHHLLATWPRAASIGTGREVLCASRFDAWRVRVFGAHERQVISDTAPVSNILADLAPEAIVRLQHLKVPDRVHSVASAGQGHAARLALRVGSNERQDD